MNVEEIDTSNYIPGVCNINQEEIAARRMTGHAGVVLFIAIAAVLFLSHAEPLFRLFLFIPAFLAVIGYMQAMNSFCVRYAAAGKQNASNAHPGAQDINNPSAVGSDRQRALKMVIQSAVIAVLITIIFVFI